jgi:ribosomal protein S18 acetylase RimI-like enzyme
MVGVTDLLAHPLDNAVWSSLTGPHAHFAVGAGAARRYPADMSPFMAVPPGADASIWAAVEQIVAPGEVVAVFAPPTLVADLPAHWEITLQGQAVQLIATDALVTAPAPEAVVLGADDVDEMLDLVARTQPGPFLPGTYRMGTYLGIREHGKLVALAGERLHPPGWTEISAVCTDPSFRGRGLASLLVRAVADGIRARGETPLMHAASTNTNAIRLYESMGFAVRLRTGFFALRYA